MPIALSEELRELAEVTTGFLTRRGALAASRALLDAKTEDLPPFWDELVSMGWLGLHLPEQYGGSGYHLMELAVVLEALGAAVAPGPFLPTVMASAIIDALGSDSQRERLLPALASGEALGAVVLNGSCRRNADGTLSGDLGLVLGGAHASTVVVRIGDDLAVVSADQVAATVVDGLDPTRRVCRLDITRVNVGDDDMIPGGAASAVAIARTLAAAEAAGGAAGALAMAVEYAKVREQFGRTIGTFQAVKHHLANMLVDVELAAAVAWDAARAGGRGPQGELAGAVAATQALPAFRRCAEKNIQILGGIGFTWEHDAHLYLRRASVLMALFGAEAATDVLALSQDGAVANDSIDLPAEAEAFRAEAQAFKQRYDSLPEDDRLAALIDSGYCMPHWPKPWGRGAGAVEQLVIDEELPDVKGPALGIGSWVLLTILQHATDDQVARWIRPSLEGELYWCQLFSEPNAGSDAAAIQTRATRVDGGWLVNGQKVWTSSAQNSTHGLATVRTDPTAAKHAGISTMAIDMHAKGVEVRPLREITGEALFNEVFFDDVFVPDDDVVGDVNNGWTVARATLGNERVSIGGNKGGRDVVGDDELIAAATKYAAGDKAIAVEVGETLAETHAMSALNLRQVMRAVIGAGPGPEGAVSKLLSAEHAQRVTSLALRISGEAGIADGEPRIQFQYLFDRCLTIAGGTSEIVRNIIAERILGLPRDPLAK
jgi:alkylation response protein AidB-like acyl-CoA dehydrogenase